MEQRNLIGKGMNDADLEIFSAVNEELDHAYEAQTQRECMEDLLFAKHLLETLLRKMQDS